MTRNVLVVLGAVLVLAGVVFTLQGLDILGGSSMSGQALWVGLGPIIALVGAFVIVRGVRPRS
jgi:hypothetical protein